MRRLVLIALLTATACDKSSAPAQPTLAGAWSGTGGGYLMSLTLTQNGSNVTGTGQMDGVSSSIPLSAQGSYNNPGFNLTMSSKGLSDFTYSGSLDAKGKVMTGQMNGGGFNHVEMALARR